MVRNATAPKTGANSNRFSTPLTPGRHDGLGERWSTTDTTDSTPVDLLQLRSELADAPGFEEALIERVAQLNGFRQASFAPVREVYQEGARLTVVSARASGQRVSELSGSKLPKAKRPAFVARLLQKATPALAALDAVAPGLTHAALTADRMLVTPQGGVCITEHVFGSALQQLALWPEELFLQLGLLAPAEEDGQAALDARTTVMQLAAVSLSILRERSITLDEFEHRLPALVEEFATEAGTSSPLVAPLRTWLQRALQIGDSRYSSAAEAEAGLKKLFAAAGPAAAAEIDAAPFGSSPRLVERGDDQRAPEREAVAAAPPTVPVIPRPTNAGGATAIAAPTRRIAVPQYAAWAAAALVVVAIGEGAYIAWLLTRPAAVPVQPAVLLESPQPGMKVTVDGRAVGATPLQLQMTAQTRAIRIEPSELLTPPPAVAATPTRTEADKTAAELEQAAARQRSGGIAFAAPFPLSVLEGDRVLGSTADGPVVASAGTHTLDLVNTALGYRVRQIVTFRAGSIGRMTITPPNGRISINAQPWAQVLIDDVPIGETPLANVPTAIGEHQVTFRHPQFGERRERVTVRADAPARVSTTFQR